MEELSHKYILLQDRVGSIEEGINFWRFWGPKLSPTQVLRGEILEALPGTQRPKDSSKIALVGIDSKSLRLECGMECLSRLTEEDANLLLAISSLEVRYRTYVDKAHLDFGRNIGIESKVFVTVKGASKKFPGIVRYKGELPPQKSTMFGVELIVSIKVLHVKKFPVAIRTGRDSSEYA